MKIKLRKQYLFRTHNNQKRIMKRLLLPLISRSQMNRKMMIKYNSRRILTKRHNNLRKRRIKSLQTIINPKQLPCKINNQNNQNNPSPLMILQNQNSIKSHKTIRRLQPKQQSKISQPLQPQCYQVTNYRSLDK